MPVTISNATFDGLAFPVARVRYTGNGYAASIYRDSDRTYRTRSGYDHALSPARNALRAALKAHDKMREEIPASDEFVAIPGDFNGDTYTFTFVPKHFFA